MSRMIYRRDFADWLGFVADFREREKCGHPLPTLLPPNRWVSTFLSYRALYLVILSLEKRGQYNRVR